MGHDPCAALGPLQVCSDHGVCMGSDGCRCDSMWFGETCDTFFCSPESLPCGDNGDCINEREHGHACANASGNLTTGLCDEPTGRCVAAYHECPGFSEQVDPEGHDFPAQPKHDSILYAKCRCRDGWSGNDCSLPPPAEPTPQPWPDPMDQADAGIEPSAFVAIFAGVLGGVIATALALLLGCQRWLRSWRSGGRPDCRQHV